MPIVVEIIDTPERIAAFIPTLDKIVAEGIVTVEKIHILTYRRDNSASTAGQPDGELQLDIDDSELTDDATPVFEAPTLFAMSTDQSRAIIGAAQKFASGSRRAYIDSVDVLLAMLGEENGIAANVLRRLGVESKAVERSLRESVTRDEPSNVFVITLDAKSLAAAKWLEHDYPGTEHLLLALCQIRPSAATDILTRLGAQPRDICNEILEFSATAKAWQGWLADHPDM